MNIRNGLLIVLTVVSMVLISEAKVFHVSVPHHDGVPLAPFKDAIGIILRNYSKGDLVAVTVDSGGGSFTYYAMVHEQLKRLGSHGIGWTAFVEGISASGGYMAILSASKIYITGLSTLGSIGVVVETRNIHHHLAGQGIFHERFIAGSNKRHYSPERINSIDDKEKMQNEVDYVHAFFIDELIKYRGKSIHESIRHESMSTCRDRMVNKTINVSSRRVSNSTSFQYNYDDCVKVVQQVNFERSINLLSQGDTWIGKDAVKLGLADGFGVYEDFVLVAERAGHECVDLRRNKYEILREEVTDS